MKLPNAEHAFISVRKLDGYLLSEAHPAGQSKAEFFRAIGFSRTDADTLRAGLVAIAQGQEVTETASSSHGTKYVVDGWLSSPTGRMVEVRTVWIMNPGEDIPRLVTAYPH
jgi:hypothetical protein